MARTLDELAAQTGLSRATVSRAISGGTASPAARKRVLEAVQRTGYRPNAAARRLASGRSGVVGVVVHVPPQDLFGDPYFAQLLAGMSDALATTSRGVMVWLGNRTKTETLDDILTLGLLDGVIVTAHELDDPLVDGLLASSMPTVLIGHRRADRTASYVDIDHVAAADDVTTHLIRIGRRRIGHITGRRRTVAAEDRISGFRRAMGRAGLAVEDRIVDGAFDRASGVAGAEVLCARGVDAIFCANDAMAQGALEAIHARGLCVPEDVALAGFDDLEFAARLDPPLTTVRQGVREQGVEAAHALQQLIGDPAGGPRRVVLPTELVIRRSTVGNVAATRPARSAEDPIGSPRQAQGVA